MDAKISEIENPATKFSDPSTWNLGGFLTGGGINLLDLIFFFIGLLFFANLTIASLTYITSEGDPAKVSKASSRITTSLLGLVIVFSAFVIVRLVASLYGFGGPLFVPFS